jgi:hypothetical protein
MFFEPVSIALTRTAPPQTERLPAFDVVLEPEPAKPMDRVWDELVDWFDRQREWVEVVASLEAAR